VCDPQWRRTAHTDDERRLVGPRPWTTTRPAGIVTPASNRQGTRSTGPHDDLRAVVHPVPALSDGIPVAALLCDAATTQTLGWLVRFEGGSVRVGRRKGHRMTQDRRDRSRSRHAAANQGGSVRTARLARRSLHRGDDSGGLAHQCTLDTNVFTRDCRNERYAFPTSPFSSAGDTG